MSNTFPTAVIPSPIPSNGLNSSTMVNPSVTQPQVSRNTNVLAPFNPQGNVQINNPVIDAAAGPKCNIPWVSGIDEVLSHPTSPKEQMYFHDKNDSVIYCRETDGNGNVINPIRALRYTVEEIPFGPEAQFVTKDEHKQLYDLVEKLSGNIDSMNSKLEQLLNG